MKRPEMRVSEGWSLWKEDEALGSTNGDRAPNLFHPPNHLPLLWAPRVRVNTENGTDASLVLANALDPVDVVLGAAHGGDRGVGGDAEGVDAASIGGIATPRLLEDDWVGTSAVVSCDGSPEASAMRGVDSLETTHVDWVALHVPRAMGGETRAAWWRRQRRAV